MRIRDTIRFSLGNLRQRKLRSALTMIGVAIGVGAIVLMVSFGVGLQNTIAMVLEAGDSPLEISVIPLKVDLWKGPPKPEPMRLYTEDDLKKLQDIPGVRAVWPDLEIRGRCEVGRSASMIEVLGMPEKAITDHLRRALVAGEWWSDDDRQVAIVPLAVVERARPQQAAERDEKERSPPVGEDEASAFVGQTVKLVFSGQKDTVVPRGLTVEGPDDKGRRRVPFRVVGVYDEKRMGGLAGGIYIPIQVAKRVRPLAPPQWHFSEDGAASPLKEGEYLTVTVKARALEDVADILKRLEEMNYPYLTVTQVIGFFDKLTLVLKAALGSLGAIGLVVAFFGIVNTMIMAILERTQEIGMLKALGARNRDIRRIFFLEASAIGLFGGLFGLLGGWLASLLMSVIARATVLTGRQFEDWELFQVSAPLAFGSVAFGVFVAASAGLIPAIRASRLDPVTALRHE